METVGNDIEWGLCSKRVELAEVEAWRVWRKLKMISDCLRIREKLGWSTDVRRNEMGMRGEGWRWCFL